MGLFRGDDEFYDTRMGGNVRTARHALAIDEQRDGFAPTLWEPREGVDLKQVWFAACHGDVGAAMRRTTMVRASGTWRWVGCWGRRGPLDWRSRTISEMG